MRLLANLPLSRPILAIGSLRIAIADVCRRRRSRPWLAMVAVPLTLNAAWLTEVWWAPLPLGVCAWWWSDRSWRWTWLVAVEAGAFGALWSYSGASALREFPRYRLVVGAVWIAMALALAGVSAYNRAQNGNETDYPGY